MPDFVSQYGTPVSPWGVNEFLRSTKNLAFESYTVSAASVPDFVRDGNPGQKELKAGTVMAKITSGPEAGKIGPYCDVSSGAAEVQTITKSGTWTGVGGTYNVGVTGSTDPDDTKTLAAGATAADLQAALRAMPSYADTPPTVTGGPLGTTAFTITFGGALDVNVPQLTFDGTALTGGTTPSATVATTTPGAPGVDDGRDVPANIVGLLLTSVPWQLIHRDVEGSVAYKAEVVQGWCLEMNGAGQFTPLSNTTAAAMQRGGAAGKMVDIGFH